METETETETKTDERDGDRGRDGDRNGDRGRGRDRDKDKDRDERETETELRTETETNYGARLGDTDRQGGDESGGRDRDILFQLLRKGRCRKDYAGVLCTNHCTLVFVCVHVRLYIRQGLFFSTPCLCESDVKWLACHG